MNPQTQTLIETALAAAQKATVKRMFPIMRNAPIPWEVIAPFENQAQTNHNQSLQRLAERGGLGPEEAYYILIEKPWPWKGSEYWKVDEATAKQKLREIVDAHENSECSIAKRQAALVPRLALIAKEALGALEAMPCEMIYVGPRTQHDPDCRKCAALRGCATIAEETL